MPLVTTHGANHSVAPHRPVPAWSRVSTLTVLLLALILLAAAAPQARAARIVGDSKGFCAITSDRGVACWGTNYSGGLGVPGGSGSPDQRTPARVPGVTDARSIATAGGRRCALSGTGTVLCWGGTSATHLDGVPVTAMATLPDAVEVAVTRNHLCVSMRDGTLSCATFLAQEETRASFVPVRGATRVKSLVTDGEGDLICMLRAKRSPLCISDRINDSGTAELVRTGMPSAATGAVAVVGTSGSACYVARSGRVRCNGQDPLDPFASQGEAPALKHPERFRTLAGIADATGLASGSTLCVIRRGGRLTCLNPNDAVSTRRQRPSTGGATEVVRGIDGVREAASLYGTTCAIRDGGAVWCWGRGFTGIGSTFSATPVTVPGLTDVQSISVTRSHSCAVRTGGSVWCWGSAGEGASGARYSVTPTRVDGIENATTVSSVGDGTCALTTSDALRCWGPLGSGAMRPVAPITLATVRSATGTPVSLDGFCVRIDGRVDCLELGYRKRKAGRPEPKPTGTMITQPGLSEVAEVVDDGSVRCVIHTDRTVTCAGTGWLAPQDKGSVPADPRTMAGLSGVVRLSRGAGPCAVIEGGRATCWAYADPTYDGVSLPFGAQNVLASPGHLIPGVEDAVDVAADGPGGPCVLRSSGSVRCARAPVVPTTFPGTPTPMAYEGYDVPGIGDAKAISTAPDHTCVLRRAGTVACWGEGGAGQLGDGGMPAGHGPQFVPTPVSGLTTPTD